MFAERLECVKNWNMQTVIVVQLLASGVYIIRPQTLMEKQIELVVDCLSSQF